MRKWIIAGVVLLLLCVAAFVAVLNLNSLIRRNKDYLLVRAQQALGRKISVGDASVTIFGGIGVRLSDFALSDDPAYSSGDFVRAKDLQITVKLWPLLKKEVQVKRAILHEPVIAVIRNATGSFNFFTIGRKEKKEEAKEREPAVKEAPPAFLVSLVDISGGEVSYRDQKEGMNLEVKQIDLKVKDLDFDKPFAVELAAAWLAGKQNLKIKTRVGPLRRDSDFYQLPLDGEIQIDPLDLGKLKAAVPTLKSTLPKDLDLAGVFRIKELKLKGTLKNLALKMELEGTDGTINFGKTFKKAPGIPLLLSADLQYAGKTASIRHADVKLHALAIAAKGEVKLGDSPLLNLSIDSKPFSLEGWEKLIPAMESYQLSGKMEVHATARGIAGKGATPQIQGRLILTEASAKSPLLPKAITDLNTQINFTGQEADIKETGFSLGNSRIRFAAAIDRFIPLALSFKLSTPELRPADFQVSLPDERKADVIKNLSSEGRLGIQNGTATFQGRLASTEGTLYKVGYKGLDATLSVAEKVATIRSLRVNALNGVLQVEGEYAFHDPLPRFSLASKIRGIDLKELYTALDAKAERDIRGQLNADMKVSGSGQKWDEMKSTLRGQGEAEVVQGAVLNFNIAESTLSGITGIPGLTNIISPRVRKKYPETFEAKDTEFKELKALFDLGDSRVNVKSLRIAAADYSVQGNGWADFDRKVDFRSVLMFSQRLSADLGESAREVKYLFNNENHLEIPFALTGRLPKVKAKPDSQYLGKMVQRGFLRRGTEELQRRFFGTKESTPPQEAAPEDSKKRKRGSTEDLIRKGLEGLFKR